MVIVVIEPVDPLRTGEGLLPGEAGEVVVVGVDCETRSDVGVDHAGHVQD